MDDPFFKHKVLFFLGIGSVVLSISLIVFSLYIFPYLFFGFNYQVPGFIPSMVEWYRFYYQINDFIIAIVIFLPFLLAGLAFSLSAKIINTFMEKEADKLAKDNDIEIARSSYDPQSMIVVIKVLLLIAVLIIIGYIIVELWTSNTITQVE